MIYLIIHFTGTDVVVARFSQRKKALAFLQGVRRPLPESGAFRELLSGFDLAEGRERVVLSIPPAMVHSRQLSFPISDRRRLRELLPLELAGEIAVQSEEMVFDALPLGNDAVLAVWSRASEIAPMIEELASAGLEPEIVTCSLLHWHFLIPMNTEAPVAVTDGNAMMVGNSSGPLLARSLPVMQADRELSRTLAAFEISRGVSVSSMLRIGGTERDNSSIPLNSELLEAFNDDSRAARDISGAYAVAKACSNGSVINFRSGSLAYTAGQAKHLRRLRLTAILASALVLILFAEVGVRYFHTRRDLASLEASISTIYKGIFPTRKKPVDPVGEIRSEIRRLAGGGAANRVLPVLKKLADLKGEEVTGFYEIEIEGENIQLKGDAKSVNEFKARAERALPGAEISEIKSKSDGSVSFVFRGSMKEINR